MTRCFLLLLMIFIVAFTSMTCHQPTQPQPGSDSFTISLSDTSCTVAWLSVHLGASFSERTVEITRDSAVVLTLNLRQTDTTMADTGLMPNKAYTYVAQLTSGATVVKSTDPLYVRTLDTTSSNLTFQTSSFGGNSGSCTLNDVAIINDTLAYAVGAIYLNDSTTGQPDPLPYNLAKWNGTSWQLTKVAVQTTHGLVTAPFYGIYPFSRNDIWILSGLPIHGDGTDWTQYDLYGMGVLSQNNGYLTKAWGQSSSDICFIGTQGTIVYYNGSSWTQLASGTTLDILDVYGAGNQILAVASDNNPYGETILSISGNTATQISSNPLGEDELYGVWFIPNRHYYVVGDGIYEKHLLSESTWKNGTLDITQYATTSVKGNGINDVFVVGGYGEFLHWNGVRWQSYIAKTGLNGSYTRVAVDGNLIIAVGQNNTQAAITIARR